MRIEIRCESGEAAEIDDVGEIWAKGPNVMLGYWRNAVATTEVKRDGWLKIGDMGRRKTPRTRAPRVRSSWRPISACATRSKICSRPWPADRRRHKFQAASAYGLPQGQDEFYFSLPHREMDLALWAHNHQVPAAELGTVLGLSEQKAQFIYDDIEAKRRATKCVHRPPVLIEDVNEIEL